MVNSRRPDLRWIYRKFAQAGIAIALVILVIGMWHSATNKAASRFEQHAFTLARAMVKQSGIAAAEFANNNDKINQIIEQVAQSDFILDASLYDTKGQLLAKSSNALPTKVAVGLQKPDNNTESVHNRFPIVETLYQAQNPVGYLRVTFDYDAVQKDSTEFQQDYSALTRLMLFLTGLIGVLFARAFSKS